MLTLWKSWNRGSRILFASVIALVLLASGWFAVLALLGEDHALHWVRFQEVVPMETIARQIQSGPYTFSIPGEAIVLYEYLAGSPLIPNDAAQLIALIGLMLGFVMLLTVLSTTRGFWFYLGSAAFILFLVSLQVNVVMLFKINNKYLMPGLYLIAYGIPLIFFRYFFSNASLILRFIAFFGLTLLLSAVTLYFADVAVPEFHLTLTSYFAALVLTVLFALLVGNEIPLALMSLANQRKGNNLPNFLIIMILYIVAVFFGAIREAGFIQWSLFLIDPYFLLFISGLLALYRYVDREPLFEDAFPDKSFAALFILALSLIAFVTLAGHLANFNDSALKVLRDMIMFSQFGYAFAFLLYFVSNFSGVFARNLEVDKVLYNPKFMPWFTFRFAGTVVVLAMAILAGQKEYYYHSISGFYSYAGDMHAKLDNRQSAIAFYETSAKYGFGNIRSNYILSNYREETNDFVTAAKHLDRATFRQSNDYVLTNLGNTMVRQNELSQATLLLSTALKRKPESGPLNNNLGVLYLKQSYADSAVQYLERGIRLPTTKNTAAINIMALLTNSQATIDLDSLLQVEEFQSPKVLANALALALTSGQKIAPERLNLDTTSLDIYKTAVLANFILNPANELSDAWLAGLDKLSLRPEYESVSTSLRSSLAHAYYAAGHVEKAFSIAGELAYRNTSLAGRFNYIQGLWALEQQAPEQAASFLAFAQSQDYKYSRILYPLTLAEAGNASQTKVLWDSLQANQSLEVGLVVRAMRHVATYSESEMLELGNDDELLQYSRLRVSLRDSTAFNRIIARIKNPDLKLRALLDRTLRLLEADETDAAVRVYLKVRGLRFTDQQLGEELRYLELRLLSLRKEFSLLANRINQGITFTRAHRLEKELYTAQLSEASDPTKAESHYRLAGSLNPFYEEGVIAAADFFIRKYPDTNRGYEILADALQRNVLSVRLLKAYIAEARRKEYTIYEQDATQRLNLLLQARGLN